MTTQEIDLSPDLQLGAGWYEPENFAGSNFRWARSGAQLFVFARKPLQHSLEMEIEPGPGVGLSPFELDIASEGKSVAKVGVKGRQQVQIALPSGHPAAHRLVFTASNSGKVIPGDARHLDFRVFGMRLLAAKPDIAPAYVNVGRGWQPIEERDGARFRWVENDARLHLKNPLGLEQLTLDVEPGPGIDAKSFVLHVRMVEANAEKSIADLRVAHRCNLDIPLPRAENVEIALRIDEAGHRVGTDPRILNFRAFAPSSS